MRKFWLENQYGKLWNLTSNNRHDKTASFLSDPDGLGIKTKISSFEIENTIFVDSVTTQTQTISGTLFFVDYSHFQRFVSFVGNVNTEMPLKLFYSTEGVSFDNQLDKQWYKLVLISELKKNEIELKTSVLKVEIKFECLSRWRQDKQITLELARTGSPLQYPYIYPFVYGGHNNIAVEINNAGSLPTSCMVRIDGITDAPTFRLLQNGEIIDQAQYHLVIDENEYLLVDSSADKQKAILCKPIGGQIITEDVYHTGEKNYAFSNFITIPMGVSMFLITAENTEFGQVTLSYSIQKELV